MGNIDDLLSTNRTIRVRTLGICLCFGVGIVELRSSPVGPIMGLAVARFKPFGDGHFSGAVPRYDEDL